jgi:tRNA-2-methylthio-N6-dimethylallyladenosine synthase
MPDQVSKEVVQERYVRLTALQDRISLEENRAQIGRRVEVLVGATEGKRDHETARITGRAEDSRLVHVDLPAGAVAPRPGDVVTATVTAAAPYFLIAGGEDGFLPVRRTRAGDAWDRAEASSCGVPAAPDSGAPAGRVSLGLPSLRVSTTPIYPADDGERTSGA